MYKYNYQFISDSIKKAVYCYSLPIYQDCNQQYIYELLNKYANRVYEISTEALRKDFKLADIEALFKEFNAGRAMASESLRSDYIITYTKRKLNEVVENGGSVEPVIRRILPMHVCLEAGIDKLERG